MYLDSQELINDLKHNKSFIHDGSAIHNEIPYRVLCAPYLRSLDKLIFGDIHTILLEGNPFFKSNDTLAKFYNTSTSSVSRSFKRLTEQHWINKTKHKDKYTGVYYREITAINVKKVFGVISRNSKNKEIDFVDYNHLSSFLKTIKIYVMKSNSINGSQNDNQYKHHNGGNNSSGSQIDNPLNPNKNNRNKSVSTGSQFDNQYNTENRATKAGNQIDNQYNPYNSSVSNNSSKSSTASQFDNPSPSQIDSRVVNHKLSSESSLSSVNKIHDMKNQNLKNLDERPNNQGKSPASYNMSGLNNTNAKHNQQARGEYSNSSSLASASSSSSSNSSRNKKLGKYPSSHFKQVQLLLKYYYPHLRVTGPYATTCINSWKYNCGLKFTTIKAIITNIGKHSKGIENPFGYIGKAMANHKPDKIQHNKYKKTKASTAANNKKQAQNYSNSSSSSSSSSDSGYFGLKF